MTRKLRIMVDHGVCVGNDMCTNIAINLFALNDDLQSEPVNAAGDPLEKVPEAAENCPVSAINVEDEDTGETLFP